MAHRMFSLGAAALALTALAGTAQATFFSFASDVNHQQFTFQGSAGSGGSFKLTNFTTPNTFNLVIDDNNGPQPAVILPVEFRADLTATSPVVSTIGGTLVEFNYRVTGTFSFFSTAATGNGVPAGTELLRVTVGTAGQNGGLLKIPGTVNGSTRTWSSVGAVLGADSFADVTYTAFTALVTAMGGAGTAANYNIAVGAGGQTSSTTPDDFAFTLSALQGFPAGLPVTSTGPAVALDANNLPTTAWRSESSYSGSAIGGIPTPAATALLGVAGLVATRRRR